MALTVVATYQFDGEAVYSARIVHLLNGNLDRVPPKFSPRQLEWDVPTFGEKGSDLEALTADTAITRSGRCLQWLLV